MGMLHVVDPATEDEHDKLRKVRSLLNVFKEKCKSLYQPFQNVAVDERMVKSKHRRLEIRQYIKDMKRQTDKMGDQGVGSSR